MGKSLNSSKTDKEDLISDQTVECADGYLQETEKGNEVLSTLY